MNCIDGTLGQNILIPQYDGQSSPRENTRPIVNFRKYEQGQTTVLPTNIDDLILWRHYRVR